MSLSTGIGLGLTNDWGSLGLSSLFAAGENGFLFDGFGDTSRLFGSGSANSTNISGDGQIVGFAFENSVWNGKSLSQVSADAPQLLPDPGFDNPADWTLTQATVAGSLLTINSPTGSYAAGLDTINGLTVGGFYELTTTINSQTRGNGTLGFSGSSAAVTGTVVGLNKGYIPAGATSSGWELKRNQTVDTLFDASAGSMKRIAGNHFHQVTSGNRPVWKAGAKPYLQFNGTTNSLLNPGWKPGQAATVAVAFRQTAAVTCCAFGAGQAAGNKRLRLGLAATGRAELAYNDLFIGPQAVNKVGIDVVLAVTYDVTGYEFYVDGVLVGAAAIAPLMDGLTGITALGAGDGGGFNFMTGNLYGALALSRRATPSEISLISSRLRSRIP